MIRLFTRGVLTGLAAIALCLTVVPALQPNAAMALRGCSDSPFNKRLEEALKQVCQQSLCEFLSSMKLECDPSPSEPPRSWCGGSDADLAAAVCAYIQAKKNCESCTNPTVPPDQNCPPSDCSALMQWLRDQLGGCTCAPAAALTPEVVGAIAKCAGCNCNNPVVCPTSAGDFCDAVLKTLQNAAACFANSPASNEPDPAKRKKELEKALAQALCAMLDEGPNAACSAIPALKMGLKDAAGIPRCAQKNPSGSPTLAAIQCIAGSDFRSLTEDGSSFLCELLKCSALSGSPPCDTDGNGTGGECADLALQIELKKASNCAACPDSAPCEPSITPADAKAIACAFMQAQASGGCGNCGQPDDQKPPCGDVAACLQTIEEIDPADYCSILNGSCSGSGGGSSSCSDCGAGGENMADLIMTADGNPGPCADLTNVSCDDAAAALEGALIALGCSRGITGDSLDQATPEVRDATESAIAEFIHDFLQVMAGRGCANDCDGTASAAVAAFGGGAASRILKKVEAMGAGSAGAGCSFPGDLSQLGRKRKRKSDCKDRTKSSQPVDLTSGDKIETATDLVVALPGEDFTFDRSYSSGPFRQWTPSDNVDYNTFRELQAGWVRAPIGAGWTTFLFMTIEEVAASDTIRLHSENAGEFREFRKVVGSFPTTYAAAGSDDETITVVSTPEVGWRLVVPGGTITTFKRVDPPEGIIANSRGYISKIEHASGRRDEFEYQGGAPLDPLLIVSTSAGRPRYLYLGMYGAETPLQARARLSFQWDRQTDSSAFTSRLATVTVERPVGNEWIETNRVEYRYLISTSLQFAHPPYVDVQPGDIVDGQTNYTVMRGLGTIGDLIQVTQVDQNLSTPASERVRITQYRYHTSSRSRCDEGVPQSIGGIAVKSPSLVEGIDHQLKMVIRPEQIERAALALAGNWLPESSEAVRTIAERLLYYRDEFLVVPPNDNNTPNDASDDIPGIRLIDLASKVIGYYTDYSYATSGRVREQFLQGAEGCGCAGTSTTRGVLQVYRYFGTGQYPEEPAQPPPPQVPNPKWLTTQVLEYTYDKSFVILDCNTDPAVITDLANRFVLPTDQAFRETRYDYKYDSDDMPMLMFKAVSAKPADSSSVGLLPTDWWVEAYCYSEDANALGATIWEAEPSAIGSYTAAIPSTNEVGYTPPSATERIYQGVVRHYTLSPDGERVIAVKIGKGTNSPADSPLVESTTYFQAPSGWSSAAWAYWRSLPVSTTRYPWAYSSGPSDEEVTTYSYTFDTSTPLVPRIVTRQTTVEAEPASENGLPSPPREGHSSIDVFDSHEDLVWSKSPDFSVTRFKRDAITGEVVGILANMTPGTPGWIGDSLDQYPGLGVSGWGIKYDQGSTTWPGGVLETTYTLDLAGRQVGVRRPAPAGEDSNETFTIRTMAASRINSSVKIYREVALPDKQGSTFAGPAQLTDYTAGGQVANASSWSVTLPPAGSGLSAYLANELSRSENEYSVSGALLMRKVWERIPAANDPVSPLVERYSYDERGRLQKRVQSDGLVEWYDYKVQGSSPAYTDNRDRIRAIYRGNNPASPASTGNAKIADYYYDTTRADNGTLSSINGAGNQTLTRYWFGTGANEYRDAYRVFDARGRVVQIRGYAQGSSAVLAPIGPHEVRVYDNLDRVVERAMFSSISGMSPNQGTDGESALMGAAAAASSATNNTILLYSQAAYNQRGLQYRVDVATDAGAIRGGLVGQTELRRRNTAWLFPSLVNYSWFDPSGRPIVNIGPSGAKTKRSYDGHGRVEREWKVAGAGDVQADAAGASVDADYVIEQSTTEYNLRGMPWLTTKWLRNHDDTNLGDLDGGGHAAVKTYVGFQYDTSDRLRFTINFGTNKDYFETGGSKPTLQDVLSTDPYAIPSALVDEIGYNSRGLVGWTRRASQDKPSAPSSIENYTRKTAYRYDALDREVAVIENADETLDPEAAVTWSATLGRWVLGGSYLSVADQSRNRTTSKVYDAGGRVSKQVAHLPASTGEGTQVTAYIYGAQVAGSFRPDLLNEAQYPNETIGAPSTATTGVVKYGYNLLGELTSMKDQNGTRHEYSRDIAGRVTLDGVYDIPADSFNTSTNTRIEIDSAIKAIAIEYDGAGRLKQLMSTSDSNGTKVVNGLGFTYTPLWQPATVVQNSSGAALTSKGTPVSSAKIVQNSYETTPYDPSLGTLANYSRLYVTRLPIITWARLPRPWEIFYDHSDWDSTEINQRTSRASAIFLTTYRVTPYDDDFYYLPALYSYVGTGTVVGVQAQEGQLALDRTWSNDGRKRRIAGFTSQAPGVYPGLDRFGRVIRQTWLDGAVGKAANGDPASRYAHDGPAIFDEVYSYDKLSNRLSARDGRTQASWDGRDAAFSYDRLDRLTKSLYSPAAPAISQQWNLDAIGNWASVISDYSDDGIFGNTGDLVESRTSNMANELLLRSREFVGTTNTAPLRYDHAGNVAEEGQITTGTARPRYLRHDAWNRLVEVREVYGSESYQGRPGRLLARYSYNGAHWRIGKQVDLDSNGKIDRTISMCYDASWRMVQEEHTDQTDGKGTISKVLFQQVWGNRYIDDAILRVRCENTGQPTTPGYQAYFQLSNAQFSTVAVLDEGMNIVERVKYLPYGGAIRTPRGDVNGDGSFNINDHDLVFERQGESIGSPNYTAELDLDRSGTIDSADYDIVVAELNNPNPFYTPGNQISNNAINSPGPRNPVGYCGYLFNSETRLYTVRNRNYSPTLGRWLERDPAGYVDGMNLYEYVRGRSTYAVDPLGLCKCSTSPQPPAVTDTPNVEQPSRDTVIDFDNTWFTPRGTENVHSWAELVQTLKKRIEDGKAGKCWTISGHGRPGIFNPNGTMEGGGTNLISLNGKEIEQIKKDLANKETCAKLEKNSPKMLAEYRAIHELIELSRTHLANGGTLEFVGCESGSGEGGQRLGEALAREMPGVRILLYEESVQWAFWGRLTQSKNKEDGKTTKDAYSGKYDTKTARAREFLCKPADCDKAQDGSKQGVGDGK
jgi:RHS repeat-associated protein